MFEGSSACLGTCQMRDVPDVLEEVVHKGLVLSQQGVLSKVHLRPVASSLGLVVEKEPVWSPSVVLLSSAS